MTLSDNGRNTTKDSPNLSLDQYAKIEAVKALDLRAALEFYGVEFNRHGFARCPFHSEKTASFKLYNNKFKCFGCGVTGDLIQFVQQKFKLNFFDAIDALCRDFKINAAPSLADLRRHDELKLKKFREKKDYSRLLAAKNDIHELYVRSIELYDIAMRLPLGCSPENDALVDAKFCELELAHLLEQADADCIEYAQNHPGALPVAPTVQSWPKLSWNAEAKQIINSHKFARNRRK